MMRKVTRREFVSKSASTMLGAAALMKLGSGAVLADTPSKPAAAASDRWAFGLLGDTHYDLWEHHDMDWVRREKPNDIRQIEGYVRVTEEILPQLATELREVIHDSPAPVEQVLHIGDFVEGLCGSYELQVRQFEDAIDWVNGGRWGAPFLITKGNHDITGPGAREAYNDIMLPFLGRQIGQELESASFAFQHRNALFVFFDAYERAQALPWLEKTLSDRSAQHLFVLVHPPVVPYQARSSWIVYSRPEEQEDRLRLLNLLGEHRAIVLSGHLHRYGFVRRRTETGHFVELALNSVIRSSDHQPRQALEGLENYGPDIVTLEPRFSPDTEAERRQIFVEEAPFIEHFETATAEGYGMVNIDGERVTVDVYKGLGRRLWKTLDVSAVLDSRLAAF